MIPKINQDTREGNEVSGDPRIFSSGRSKICGHLRCHRYWIEICWLWCLSVDVSPYACCLPLLHCGVDMFFENGCELAVIFSACSLLYGKIQPDEEFRKFCLRIASRYNSHCEIKWFGCRVFSIKEYGKIYTPALYSQPYCGIKRLLDDTKSTATINASL